MCQCQRAGIPTPTPTPAPAAPKSVPDDMPAGVHGLCHAKRQQHKMATAPRSPPPSSMIEVAASSPLCQRQRAGTPTCTHRPKVSAGRCAYRGAWPAPCETTTTRNGDGAPGPPTLVNGGGGGVVAIVPTPTGRHPCPHPPPPSQRWTMRLQRCMACAMRNNDDVLPPLPPF